MPSRRLIVWVGFMGLWMGACVPLTDQSTHPNPSVVTSANAFYQAWAAKDTRALARFWSNQGDDARALAYWESHSADNPTLLRLQAQTYLDLGEWHSASQALASLLAQNPEDTWANYQMALLLVASDRTQARLFLRRSVQSDTIESQDPLIAQLQSLLDQDPPDLAFQMGQILAQAGEWRAAERAFLIAAGLDNRTTALSLAYSALMRNLQNKSALIPIQQALALSPEDPNVQYVYGIILRGEERYDESLSALKFAYALVPDNAVFVAELGMAYLMLNDHANANAWLQHAFQLAQDDALRLALQRYAQNGNASILLPELPEP